MVFEDYWMDDPPLFVCHPAGGHHPEDSIALDKQAGAS